MLLFEILDLLLWVSSPPTPCPYSSFSSRLYCVRYTFGHPGTLVHLFLLYLCILCVSILGHIIGHFLLIIHYRQLIVLGLFLFYFGLCGHCPYIHLPAFFGCFFFILILTLRTAPLISWPTSDLLLTHCTFNSLTYFWLTMWPPLPAYKLLAWSPSVYSSLNYIADGRLLCLTVDCYLETFSYIGESS